MCFVDRRGCDPAPQMSGDRTFIGLEAQVVWKGLDSAPALQRSIFVLECYRTSKPCSAFEEIDKVMMTCQCIILEVLLSSSTDGQRIALIFSLELEVLSSG